MDEKITNSILILISAQLGFIISYLSKRNSREADKYSKAVANLMYEKKRFQIKMATETSLLHEQMKSIQEEHSKQMEILENRKKLIEVSYKEFVKKYNI